MADFPFLNKESMTSDQKFLLMLLERLEAVEEKLQSIEPKKHILDMYNILQKMKDEADIEKYKYDERYLVSYVPANIFVKIPKKAYKSLKQFLIEICLVNNNYNISSYALDVLKNYETADEEFITWLKTNIKIL